MTTTSTMATIPGRSDIVPPADVGPRTDVIVAGGGMAGLTAASYLARGGLSVTLFERASDLGGRAATQQHAGYAINRGIHALYTGGATSEVLRELGVTYSAGIPKATFGLWQGRLDPLPITPAALLASKLLGLGDKLELIRLLASLPRIDMRRLGGVSVQQWLDESIRRPQVHRLMTSFARTFVYSAALNLVSADVFVDKLQRSLKHPIHYVDGGWQTLVAGLRQAAERAGVRIVTGVRVEGVEHDGGVVRGVRVRDGNFVPAAFVVVATTPHEAAQLVDGGAYAPLRQMVDALVPAQVACLDVALRRLPRPRRPIVFDLERPLFLTAQSQYARVAPPGGALIHAFKQLDPRRPANQREDERNLETLFDAAQPGWRDLIVQRYFLPHITAAGALPLAASGGFAGRPGPAVPGLANLFLAGDWIGPEGFLVDASAASARRVAQLVQAASTAEAL